MANYSFKSTNEVNLFGVPREDKDRIFNNLKHMVDNSKGNVYISRSTYWLLRINYKNHISNLVNNSFSFNGCNKIHLYNINSEYDFSIGYSCSGKESSFNLNIDEKDFKRRLKLDIFS
jgi:hypothetical protein